MSQSRHQFGAALTQQRVRHGSVVIQCPAEISKSRPLDDGDLLEYDLALIEEVEDLCRARCSGDLVHPRLDTKPMAAEASREPQIHLDRARMAQGAEVSQLAQHRAHAGTLLDLNAGNALRGAR